MTMNNDEGGPAFPVVGLHIDDPWSGMPLRDWFAGKALPEEMRRYAAMRDGAFDYDEVAALTYKMADAMLRERG
ncbi:MAG: hypothetical protein O3A25_19780 [Acidobacteria bacterium]|nr:hypothetical protein [Acidobacteriota bacterium]